MIDKFMYGFLNRAYDLEDYTQLEINSKLIQKMDEVIDNCNNAFEFMDYIKEEGLINEVINILLAWKEDGTLENIIDQNVFNELNSKVDTFQENVNNDLQSKKIEIDNLRNEINNNITELSNSIDTKINELKEMINQNNSELN